MKGYVKESILYIFDHTPQDLSSVPDWEMPSGIEKIYVQTEYLDGFKELNPDYASIMVAKNFCIMQYNDKPEEDHFEDDVNGNDISISGDSSTHFTPSAYKALEGDKIIVTPESPSYFAGNITLKTSPSSDIAWNETNKNWEFTMPAADVTIKCKEVGPAGSVDWDVQSNEGNYVLTIGNNDTRKDTFESFADMNFLITYVNSYLTLVVNDTVIEDLVVDNQEVQEETEYNNLHDIHWTSESTGLDIHFYNYESEPDVWLYVEGDPSDDSSIFTFSATTVGTTYGFNPKEETDIYWSDETADVTIGADDNVFPTLTNEDNVPIFYSSTDESVATIDENGHVTLVGAGTCEIGADFFGNPYYMPESDSYELTVHSGAIDYSTRYFTVVPENNGSIKFTGNDLQVSTDGGTNWSTLTNDSSISMTASEPLMFKQTGLTPDTENGIGTFVASTNFTAEGNIMSLLYGDEFIGEDDLTGYDYAFKNLFNNCPIIDASNLILPATTLADYCYANMFMNAGNLTAVPALSATTLANYCYNFMFYGCMHLTTAPTLPATTLASHCYEYMFEGTGLTTAPTLPATDLSNNDGCYLGMFKRCTSLTATPSLPATTLSPNCYQEMFQYCTSLTTVSTLPATEIYDYNCYAYMFANCTSLTTVPNNMLPATFLGGSNCYEGMFQDCSNLTTAPALPATDLTYAHACYKAMFKSCTSLTTAPSLPATTLAEDCYYEMFKGCTSLTTAPALPATDLTDCTNCYRDMFNRCTSLTSAPTLPATTIADWCYAGMFNSCTSLTTAPALPATTVLYNSYMYMFEKCTSLTTVPALTATTLGIESYLHMFDGCTSLVTAPNISATTLASHCCDSMFKGCTSLTTIPTLPATTLADNCYYKMFAGCTSLTSAPALTATTLASHCYESMFKECSNLTSAPTLSATTLADHCYMDMFAQCTSLTTAPDLLVETLVSGCYLTMFYGCTSLNYIKMMATDISAYDCLNSWVNDVASNGTFVKNVNAQWSETDVVPNGWTVQTASAA